MQVCGDRTVHRCRERRRSRLLCSYFLAMISMGSMGSRPCLIANYSFVRPELSIDVMGGLFGFGEELNKRLTVKYTVHFRYSPEAQSYASAA